MTRRLAAFLLLLFLVIGCTVAYFMSRAGFEKGAIVVFLIAFLGFTYGPLPKVLR